MHLRSRGWCVTPCSSAGRLAGQLASSMPVPSGVMTEFREGHQTRGGRYRHTASLTVAGQSIRVACLGQAAWMIRRCRRACSGGRVSSCQGSRRGDRRSHQSEGRWVMLDRPKEYLRRQEETEPPRFTESGSTRRNGGAVSNGGRAPQRGTSCRTHRAGRRGHERLSEDRWDTFHSMLNQRTTYRIVGLGIT